MPKNVPTSAAPTLWPISSTGPSIAPIVITIPNTAATMPKPGIASAVFDSASSGAWCSSSIVWISVSNSADNWLGVAVPSITGDSAPQMNCETWWLLTISGYLLKMLLSCGLRDVRLQGDQPLAPGQPQQVVQRFEQFAVGLLVVGGPLSVDRMPRIRSFSTLTGDMMISAPRAAPPIVNSSVG